MKVLKKSITKILELQIPKKPIIEKYSPAICPNCGVTLSQSLGDGYYQHEYNKSICGCGQKLIWKDL